MCFQLQRVAKCFRVLYVSCMAKTFTYAFFVTLLCAILSACGGSDDTPVWRADFNAETSGGSVKTVASTLDADLQGPDVSLAPVGLLAVDLRGVHMQVLSQPVQRIELAAELFAVAPDGKAVQLGLTRSVSASIEGGTLTTSLPFVFTWTGVRIPAGQWTLVARYSATAYSVGSTRIAALGQMSAQAHWMAALEQDFLGLH